MKLFSKSMVLQGKWRLAESSEPVIPGTLKISRSGGPILHLSGGFHSPRDFFKQIKHQALWGELFDGKKVTLYDCYLDDQNVNREIFDSSYRVGIVISGKNFVSPAKTKFSAVNLQISSLHNWLGKHLIHSDSDNFSMKYTPISKEQFEIPHYGIVEFGSGVRTHGSWKSGHIDADAYIDYKWFDDPKLIRDCVRVPWVIQRFYQLLMGGKSHIEQILFQDAETKNWLSFYSSPQIEGKPADLAGHHMLAPYFKIKEIFPSVFSEWLRLNENFDDELWLYNKSALLEGPFTHFDFLAMTQVLESYHRHFGEKPLYMEQERYNEDIYAPLIAALPSSISSSHRDALKGRLKYGNEISFAKRLTELVNSLSETELKWVCGNASSFINRIKSTRNFHTHLDTDNEALVFKDLDRNPCLIRV